MGDTPYLTAVIVNDGEKDPKLLEYCFQAIRLFNEDAIPETQFIVLNQDPDGAEAHELARAQPFDVEWFDAGYECVGGVVLWDLMASLKKMWPRMFGRYHMIVHKEWVFGPGCLHNSIQWLKENDEPPIAMANLRRVGTKNQLSKNRMSSSGKATSVRLRKAMDGGDPEAIAGLLARIRTLPWKYWRDPAERPPDRWCEDAYFGRSDWFDSMRFFDHADKQMFQDVYDLITIMFQQLTARKLAPAVPQIPLKVGRIYHLWHSKGYPHFSDRAIEYFCGDPSRWENTQFADRYTMERLRDFVGGGARHRNPIIAFRQEVRGTAYRFAAGFSQWLQTQGEQTVVKADEPKPREKIRRVVMICSNRRWRTNQEPMKHIVTGLKRADFLATTINRRPPQQTWPPWSKPAPDGIFLWNSQNGGWADKVAELREEGKHVFVMERGFFDRFNYTQIDHQGFGHRASWANGLTKQAPVGAAKRFREAWGSAPIDVAPRSEGYILVLLQVPADVQLADSELSAPGPLVDSVVKGVLLEESDVPIRVRAHPSNDWSCGTQGLARMIDGTLKDAVAGARFVVTINSNAANEALAWGCPVLAYGPALCINARAALRTTCKATWAQIKMMLDGWVPSPIEVKNYLYHLAARQWNTKELAQGDVLSDLIAAAME